MMKFFAPIIWGLQIAFWSWAICAMIVARLPASAQLLPWSANLEQRPLPYGVSIPAVTSSSVSYPGCPGEVTTHTNTWYVDQVNGFTQSNYAAGTGGAPLVTSIGPPSGQGTAAHPWKDIQALTGNNAGTPTSGYTQVLLATAPGGSGGPIVAGDLVIVNTGSYGAVVFGSGTQIVNSPALTIQAGVGQTPLLTTLVISEGIGWHIEGQPGAKNFKIQSVNPGTGQGLAVATDNNVANSTGDIIFENIDASSASVATANAWTPIATWVANTRPGIVFQALAGPTPANTWSCASLVNSHVYEVSLAGQVGAVHGEASSFFVQGNEIDHFFPTAILFQESNVAIGLNDIHDYVQTGQGSQQYAIDQAGTGIVNPSLHQSNVYIYQNKSRESVDAGQTFQGSASFYLNSCGDVSNFVAWDNLHAGGGATGIGPGNSHNYVVANNSMMYSGTGQNPLINLTQAHCAGTGPIGIPPSNGWIFNNIAPIFDNSNGMQVYHNISAPGTTGFSTWNYYNVWTKTFVGPTPGSVITLPSITGEQNLIDGGVGGASPQANEYTAVPAASSFPMSPQPDWTPKAGSPAKTAGGVLLIPPLTDYNGATFTSPYSIGGLN